MMFRKNVMYQLFFQYLVRYFDTVRYFDMCPAYWTHGVQ